MRTVSAVWKGDESSIRDAFFEDASRPCPEDSIAFTPGDEHWLADLLKLSVNPCHVCAEVTRHLKHGPYASSRAYLLAEAREVLGADSDAFICQDLQTYSRDARGDRDSVERGHKRHREDRRHFWR